MNYSTIRIKPISWSQAILRYEETKAVGKRLMVDGCAQPHASLKLSTGQRIEGVPINLHLKNADDTRLEGAIGRLHWDANSDQARGNVSLRPEDYSEVWEQVRRGEYADCVITISVQPVAYSGEWIWDVAKHQTIYITTASIEFWRKPFSQDTVEPTKRKRWFG